MQTISEPAVLAQTFCASGDKNTIPSSATGSQLASLAEGFPPVTQKSTLEGGIPPERKDFNGALNLMSQFYYAFQNGWLPTFKTDVSAAIGGYPEGAVLWYMPTTGTYANKIVPLKSLTANNTYNFNTNPEYIGVYWAVVASTGGAGKSVGEVFWSQSSSAADNPGALPLFTGETIANADSVYPDFYVWVANHADLQISAADYSTAITTYGECPKYVIDTVNKTIRLPLLKHYIKNANTTDGITQAEAGLPNITGDIDIGGAGFASASATSALQRNLTDSRSGQGGSGSSIGLAFDASKSNSVYGNSVTVTPSHTTLFPWVCAYNAAVEASVAQAAEFQDALTGKVDLATGVSQADVDYVIETYTSGTSWYRVYKSGWCEQGGRFQSNDGNDTQVVFLKAFADTNYTPIVGQMLGSNGDATFWNWSINSLTASSMTIHNATNGTNTCIWQAAGYIS